MISRAMGVLVPGPAVELGSAWSGTSGACGCNAGVPGAAGVGGGHAGVPGAGLGAAGVGWGNAGVLAAASVGMVAAAGASSCNSGMLEPAAVGCDNAEVPGVTCGPGNTTGSGLYKQNES